MKGWSEVASEIFATRDPQGRPDFDGHRRNRIRDVEAATERPLVIYASDFTNAGKAAAGQDLLINLDDKIGFREVTENLSGDSVDVLLYSPGGSAEATESIVHILRHRFKTVRFIVPHIAKSAATMLAMSGNEILMDPDAELGPIDPQFVLPKPDGTRVPSPAQAIRDQFDEAQQILKKDPSKLAAWVPVLQQYGPSLYQEAENQIDLAKKLVSEWLKTYMFGATKNGGHKAAAVARYLANHNNFRSHGRRIGLKELKKRKVKVIDLATQPKVRDAVWELQHSILHTFGGTAAFKLIENGHGRAMIRLLQAQTIKLAPGKRPQPPRAPS